MEKINLIKYNIKNFLNKNSISSFIMYTYIAFNYNVHPKIFSSKKRLFVDDLIIKKILSGELETKRTYTTLLNYFAQQDNFLIDYLVKFVKQSKKLRGRKYI
mgnify:CR=1 FL=1